MNLTGTSMFDHYVCGTPAPYLEEHHSAARIIMLENTQPPGDVSMPPFTELVFSQAVRYPFRFQSDCGAGAFTGRAIPMDVLVVPPQASHRGIIRDCNRLRFLGIPADTARACLERDADDPLDFGPVHAEHQRDPLMAHVLEAVWQELVQEDQQSRLFVDTIIATLVVRLAQLANDRSRPDRRRGGLAPQQSARVLDYMQTHFTKRITLGELAAVAQLSPYHFARAFRATHGMPPHQYLTRLRVENARTLLAQPHISVTEVALACGYTPQQLVRHFRRHVGTTPTDFRRATVENR